jgi:hypothetical protein
VFHPPDEEEDNRRKRRPTPDDERPRKKAGKKRSAGKGAFVWTVAAVGGLVLVIVGVGGFLTARQLLGGKNNPSAIAGDATSRRTTGEASGAEGAGSREATGAKYIPRVSEQKFQDFLKGLDEAAQREVTDAQVYAIMGPPTRRDAPITGQKNGQVFTVYKAYWEEPGSGIKSSIGFANGRMSGMILGLEVTPPQASGGK